jgi:hypothetical protein
VRSRARGSCGRCKKMDVYNLVTGFWAHVVTVRRKNNLVFSTQFSQATRHNSTANKIWNCISHLLFQNYYLKSNNFILILILFKEYLLTITSFQTFFAKKNVSLMWGSHSSLRPGRSTRLYIFLRTLTKFDMKDLYKSLLVKAVFRKLRLGNRERNFVLCLWA